MEIYISVDVETDGPIPGPNSMLSLGAAAFNADGQLLATFTVNFKTLEGATVDPKTQTWWESQPKNVYDACRSNPVAPEKAMKQFANWVDGFKHDRLSPVFVGYPAGFDFLFVYWYLIKFVGYSPFSFSAIDIKTFAMAELGTPYRETTKRNMPVRWFKNTPPHTHKALDDAIEQGMLFVAMLRESLARKATKSPVT